MNLEQVSEAKDWNEFIFSDQNRFTGGEFLQSWEWGEFQKKIGRTIWRYRIKQEEETIGQALLIKHPLTFGRNYLYCPRGPILQKEKLSQFFSLFLTEIKTLACQQKAIFFRFDPITSDRFLETKTVRDFQPSQTVILDLKKSEQEILNQMHPKTRYNIRLAQKKGVKIFSGKNSKQINIFLDLLEQTGKRDKFKTYTNDYYRKLISSDFVQLYFAEYQGRVLAASLVIFFGPVATYLHGGSSRDFKETMAPYLLHWEVIKQAKANNLKFYDFWGISETKWPNLTRFKKGFCQNEINYPGTIEVGFFPIWYFCYKLFKLCYRLF